MSRKKQPKKIQSKDAKKALDYSITPYTKGFLVESVIDGTDRKEYFQFREIHKIIHHPGVGVEIIGYKKHIRVFYNDGPGESEILFNEIHTKMLEWLGSNLN